MGKSDNDFLSERTKALRRVGAGDENLARWVIRFAQTDVSKLSAGDKLNLQHELAVFIVDLDDPVNFQPIARNFLQNIVERKGIALVPDFKLYLTPSRDPSTPWIIDPMTTNAISDFKYRLFYLLGSLAHRIKKCQRCSTIFLQDRKNQSFCSRRCQTQQATYQYRLREGLITGRPRGRPPKKRRKHAKRK